MRWFWQRSRVVRSDREGRRRKVHEREHQRRYAQRHGYFWLPCDICGVEFGGHESHGVLAGRPGENGSMICPFCTGERQQAAEEKLRELGECWERQTSRWGFPGIYHHTPDGGRVTDRFEIRFRKNDMSRLDAGGESAD